MNTYISLNKQLSCEYLCNRIDHLITKFKQTNTDLDSCVLVISINHAIDNNELMPKLEFKDTNVNNQ